MANYILVMDQGTTGSRGVVYDEKGKTVAIDYEEYEQFFPNSGWWEQSGKNVREVTIRTYRKAIDDYQKDPELYRKNMPWYLDQISNCTYRQFTTGFLFGKQSEEAQIYDSNTYIREYTYLGITEEIKDGMVKIEQRNKFSVGETIEIMKPNGDNVEVQVKRIVNEEGEEQESAPHPKQVLYVDLSGRADKYDILRRKEEADE